ncbi:MAG: type I-E CRISPR-associated protein Cse1/CasA [Proteobacteria bacterium]|nr:type I-E CRISPR-associated protein Cse1/CasA [Pseudomonadota bacterium]
MPNKEFNLLHEPWIMVMKQDGLTGEVSILDVFRHAHEYRTIAGELPTQDVAVLRLLLAILHAVFGRVTPNGKYAPLCEAEDDSMALDRWEELLNVKQFPMAPIENYLAKVEDRFWLFHPETPFYQVAGMKNGTEYTASKLNGVLSESGNKSKWFSPYSGKAKETLSYSEAARWLVNINAFDDTSAKPTRGLNLPSVGAGWLGKLGLVYALGNTLFETLMLNLILVKNGNELYGPEKPVWERPVKSDERTEIAYPDNLSELYTLQSRRLLLNKSNANVTGFKLLGGDFFQKENALIEPMTIWKNTAKKETDPKVLVPRRHDVERQIWRDFESLIAKKSNNNRPGIVEWIDYLFSNSVLDTKDSVRFKAPGIAYADKDFFIENIIDDTLTIHTSLISQMAETYVVRVINQIEVCDKLVEQLGYLAKNIQLATGAGKEDKQPDGARSNAMTLGYASLDNPFREWLESIIPEETDIDKACDDWWNTAQTIIRKLAQKLIEQAGPKAFISHSDYMTSSQAYNWFMSKTSSRDALFSSKKGGKK